MQWLFNRDLLLLSKRKQHVMQAQLDALPELSNIQGMGSKLLQIARSTPGIVATLVGHKSKEHVLANTALSNIQPLTPAQFNSVMAAITLTIH